MTSVLKPYPHYKTSGLPWLDKVPARWEVWRAKFLFDEIDVRSTTGEEELLTVSEHEGVVPRSQKTVTMFKAESYQGYKLCWPGDLVINSLWAWMQGLGFSRYHGIVSSAYGVYRPKEQYAFLANYFHYLLRSNAYLWELRVRSKGIWLSRLQLTDPAFMDMPLLLPSKKEAQTIVHYLRQKDRQIYRFIRNKQRIIEILQEQKQAIINQVVTRGINPGVRLKPSGIDWLGNIPEHWEVRRAKYLFKAIDERSSTGTEELLTVSSYRGVVPRSSINVYMFKARSYEGYKLCWPGDLVINSLWAWMGGLGFSDYHGLISTAYGVYRLQKEYSATYPFFHMLLRAPAYNWELRVRSKGIWKSRYQLTDDAFFGMPIVLPSEEERSGIIAYVKARTAHIDTRVDHAQRQIDLIREYRTRLIADVVTGKVDVRDIPVEAVPEDKRLEKFVEFVETEESFEIEEAQYADD